MEQYALLNRFYRGENPANDIETTAFDSRDDVSDALDPKKEAIVKKVLSTLRNTKSARAVLEAVRSLGEPLDLDLYAPEEKLELYREKIRFLVYDRLTIGLIPEAKELIELLGEGIDFTDMVKKAYSDCKKFNTGQYAGKIKDAFPDITFN